MQQSKDKNTFTPTVKLNSGHEMPRFGLGTLQVKNLPEIVFAAIKNGVRLFDTAWIYQNEKAVGEGISKAISEGLVKREELFIATKVFPIHKEDPEASLDGQLKDLGLDYVDLYLDHAPFTMITNPFTGQEVKGPLHLFWPKMEALVKKGKAKSIGVCNYNVQSLMNLLSFAEIPPAINQFEEHPYLTQEGLVDYCKLKNIHVVAYNSLGKNFFVEAFHKSSGLSLIDDKKVVEMAKKYEVSPGVLLLNWAISRGFSIIPSTSNPDRFKENLQCLEFKMSDEDIKELCKMNIPYRFGGSKESPGCGGIDIYS